MVGCAPATPSTCTPPRTRPRWPRPISGSSTVTEAGGSFGDGSELTVTLALPEQADGAPIIQAAREGQVTLVRTTHASLGAATSSDRVGGG